MRVDTFSKQWTSNIIFSTQEHQILSQCNMEDAN